jgi:hypothetical protein
MTYSNWPDGLLNLWVPAAAFVYSFNQIIPAICHLYIAIYAPSPCPYFIRWCYIVHVETCYALKVFPCNDSIVKYYQLFSEYCSFIICHLYIVKPTAVGKVLLCLTTKSHIFVMFGGHWSLIINEPTRTTLTFKILTPTPDSSNHRINAQLTISLLWILYP